MSVPSVVALLPLYLVLAVGGILVIAVVMFVRKMAEISRSLAAISATLADIAVSVRANPPR